MKKLFLIVPLLSGCFWPLDNTSRYATIAERNELEKKHCPAKWTEPLNDDACPVETVDGIKIRTCWKNGKRNGLECSYQENGALFDETNWKDGKFHGIRRRYFDNGRLKIEDNWSNDVKDGKAEDFYGNGQMSFSGYVKNGKLASGTCYTKDGAEVPLDANYLEYVYPCVKIFADKSIPEQIDNTPDSDYKFMILRTLRY
jgi:hypothetical protein